VIGLLRTECTVTDVTTSTLDAGSMDNKCVKRLIRSKSGLRIVATDDSTISPFLLGEPSWVPDKDVGVSSVKRAFYLLGY
jgi:hypothetical protein